MNFDNLILNDLMNGLYRIIQSLLTLPVFTFLRNSLIEWISKPISWNSDWGKSKLKRESRDLCKSKNVIKR